MNNSPTDNLTTLIVTGKTISAMVLANILEEKHGIPCFVAPHDGYHYPLQHLRSAFADADDVIYRRGAPETFDAEALVRDVKRIRDGDEPIISLPGFDHAKGDPGMYLFVMGVETVPCERLAA